MMVRLIERPIPMPEGLVEKKGPGHAGHVFRADSGAGIPHTREYHPQWFSFISHHQGGPLRTIPRGGMMPRVRRSSMVSRSSASLSAARAFSRAAVADWPDRVAR